VILKLYNYEQFQVQVCSCVRSVRLCTQTSASFLRRDPKGPCPDRACDVCRTGRGPRPGTTHITPPVLVKSQERNHNDQPNIWLKYTRKRMFARKTDADSSMTIIRLVPCKMA
jgi:hypothetical protein